jgi:hypothetical protein
VVALTGIEAFTHSEQLERRVRRAQGRHHELLRLPLSLRALFDQPSRGLWLVKWLADVPDYPARLEIDYPQQLNRWLPLVKWLLASRSTYRLVVYVALMTDRYPPFRLDQGSVDPEGPEQPPAATLASQ